MNLEEIASRAKISIATVSQTIHSVRTVKPPIVRRAQKTTGEAPIAGTFGRVCCFGCEIEVTAPGAASCT